MRTWGQDPVRRGEGVDVMRDKERLRRSTLSPHTHWNGGRLIGVFIDTQTFSDPPITRDSV